MKTCNGTGCHTSSVTFSVKTLSVGLFKRSRGIQGNQGLHKGSYLDPELCSLLPRMTGAELTSEANSVPGRESTLFWFPLTTFEVVLMGCRGSAFKYCQQERVSS